MNAFERLGVPLRLAVSDEEIREAFRKKAGEAHPDSGGDAGEFAALQLAQEVLLSPGKRLKEWFSLNGIEVDSRGQIEAGLMDLFQKVAETGTAAEGAIKAGEKANSALAKAIAAVAMMAQREKVSELLFAVEAEISARVVRFSDIEEANTDAAKAMRDLVFLEKWRGTLRSIYGRLM